MNEELIPNDSDCIVCVRVGKVLRENIYEMARKLSRGMLMGARGNSGVILSQFFKGLSFLIEEFCSGKISKIAISQVLQEIFILSVFV